MSHKPSAKQLGQTVPWALTADNFGQAVLAFVFAPFLFGRQHQLVGRHQRRLATEATLGLRCVMVSEIKLNAVVTRAKQNIDMVVDMLADTRTGYLT